MADPGDDLISFVDRVAGLNPAQAGEKLGCGFVRLARAEAEERQARHDIRWVEDSLVELLRNARDAGARLIFVATERIGTVRRRLVVIDNGRGVPEDFHGLVFEPRVTSRGEKVVLDGYGLHGRGMALYAIKSMARRAEIVSSAPGRGAVVRTEWDLGRVPERADQSCRPKVRTVDGEERLSGVRNAARVATEFALAHGEAAVYLGSPAEIAAGCRSLALAGRALSPEDKRGLEAGGTAEGGVAFWQVPAFARTARELRELAMQHLGLDLSERTASRVLSGEVRPASRVDARIGGSSARQTRTIPAQTARLVSDEDLDLILAEVKEGAAATVQKYFLRIGRGSRIRRDGDQLKVSLELEKEQ